jgi:membrane associated rhomboid family serine protease
VILVLVLLGVALKFTTAAERTRLRAVLLAALHEAKDAITLQGLQCDEFFDALRARTPRVIVTPFIIVLSAAIFIRMVFDPGAIANPSTLLSWGGNVGAETTNGGWWRLVTTLFVHSRMLDLIVNAVCLFQLGLILERLVGPLAFTTVFLAAGVTAGLVGLSVSPESVIVGASGSVLGIYGLLVVTSIWSLIHPSSLTIPLDVAKRLAPVAAVFVLYNVVTTDFWSAAALTALVCGLAGGTVIARDVNDRTPPLRRLSTAMATLLAIATVYAVIMLHGPVKVMTDVGPEIERVIAVEGRTADIYDLAVARFRKGRLTAKALAETIDQTIVPEVHAAAARLHALQDVPAEHQPLVATAEEFLRLRDESWQLRAAALHNADMPGLRKADSKEQASLEAFDRMKAPPKVGGDGAPTGSAARE